MTAFTRNLGMKQALQAPIYECWEPQQLFEQGIGTVVVTRKTENNNILIGVFLLDVYCLGVKDSYIRLIPKKEYSFMLEKMRENEPLKFIHPSCARKLVEDAEDYARELGFSPHRDYTPAKKIFGEIESKACPRSFQFGKEGKPYYFAGPHDNAAFRKNVVDTLMKKCGPDGFHYVLGLDEEDFFF